MENRKCAAMQTNKTCVASGCPAVMSRRSFLATTGALLVAAEMDMLGFASSLFAAEPKPAGKPIVSVVFARPDVKRYWMGWPGAAYDIKGHQQQYTKTLTDAAKRLGVQLQVNHKPLDNTSAVNTYLKGLKKNPPDGIIVAIMDFERWGDVNHLAQNRGDIPVIIFSPQGTSFLEHIKPFRDIPKTFVAATQDVGWLAFGLRMLNTIWQMKNTRICVVQGDETADCTLDVVGTTLHYIPNIRFSDEFKKVQESEEVQAIADYYIGKARKIVEPSRQDILEAAKNYIVCRRIMAAENCQGIAMSCLPLVSAAHREKMSPHLASLLGDADVIPPPCLAFSRLRDEGIVAACQADWPSAISSRLTHLLFDRPGFMQNLSVNTVNNTLVGSHCTCATKLDGFDKPSEPFILRSHAESDLGVAPQVLWRIGQKITIMKFSDVEWWVNPASAESPASSILLGSARVLRNIDTPPSGGCRTAVEVEVDGIDDMYDLNELHHQLFIYGDHTRQLKAYAELAGIKVESI